MKTTAITILCFLCIAYLQAQQAFSFQYRLKSLNKYTYPGQRLQQPIILEQLKGTINYIPRKLGYDTRILKCVIKPNANKDTIEIMPWYSDTNNVGLLIDDETEEKVPLRNDSKYVIAVSDLSDYGATSCGNYAMIKFNYYHRQLTATNIPVILNMTDYKKNNPGQIQANPLNANLTHLWVIGRTKIYQSKFVASRASCWGLGPFVGFSIVDSPSKDTTNLHNSQNNKIIGLNYGGNIIYSVYKLNFIFAFGAESEFYTRNNHFQPYLGFGLGFKLIDLMDPNSTDN